MNQPAVMRLPYQSYCIRRVAAVAATCGPANSSGDGAAAARLAVASGEPRTTTSALVSAAAATQYAWSSAAYVIWRQRSPSCADYRATAEL